MNPDGFNKKNPFRVNYNFKAKFVQTDPANKHDDLLRKMQRLLIKDLNAYD